MTHMQTPMAFVISKDPAYGEYSQAMVRQLNGHYFEFGGDTARIAEMETFLSYCLAYDAIVDDPETTWLTAQEKAAALATMAATLERLNLEPSETWRRRPTHNFMALRAAMHAAALYNLRGEAEYEGLFHRSREYALAYHNERVNGLCDAPLQNHGPRPDDGFPYEGSNYSAYQGSRVLVHRHILEMNEYPNPDTVLDENRSGFSRNWNLAWMAVSPPGLSEWADVAYRGDHAVIQAFRYYSALNKAAGNGIAARVGEWFTREVLRSPKSTPDAWWWQGWEMMFYDASIEPLHPDHARLPLYVYLDDSEFHMYRDSWEIADPRPDDTYVYFRNSAHDGHFYWEEGHGNVGQEHECIAETSTHDGPDNGHFGIYKNGVWIAENEQPQGETQRHNCLLIDGQGSVMDGHHDSSDVSELATTDVVGAVDSAYGHALDAVLGGIYTSVDQYNRYVFVIRDPMYVIVVDELDAGHTVDFLCYPGMNITKQGEDLFTSSMARYELMYPQSGFSATGGKPIVITTSSPDVMFLVHPNPSGVSVSKSYGGGQMVAAIGEDEIVYNPAGGRYSRGSISGDATLFAQRSGGRSSSRLPKPQVRSMV